MLSLTRRVYDHINCYYKGAKLNIYIKAITTHGIIANFNEYKDEFLTQDDYFEYCLAGETIQIHLNQLHPKDCVLGIIADKEVKIIRGELKHFQ